MPSENENPANTPIQSLEELRQATERAVLTKIKCLAEDVDLNLGATPPWMSSAQAENWAKVYEKVHHGKERKNVD